MAALYILHSKTIDKFYIGSCLVLANRLQDHKAGKYSSSFTKRAVDWNIYLKVKEL